MDYKKLDYLVNKIAEAIHNEKDITTTVDNAIKWAFDSYKTQDYPDGFISEYNNLIRALASKWEAAEKVAVPRTMKIIYRHETEAFAKSVKEHMESELKIDLELCLVSHLASLAPRHRTMYYLPNTKELAKAVQKKLEEIKYGVAIEESDIDGQYSLYLWIV